MSGPVGLGIKEGVRYDKGRYKQRSHFCVPVPVLRGENFHEEERADLMSNLRNGQLLAAWLVRNGFPADTPFDELDVRLIHDEPDKNGTLYRLLFRLPRKEGVA